MHKKAANADDIGGHEDAPRRVPRQRASEAMTMQTCLNGEAAEHGDGNRVGHVATEPSRREFEIDRARGQRIVRNHAIHVADDVGARRPRRLVGAGAPLEPVVEDRNAGSEVADLVPLLDRLRRRDAIYSQGALVVMVLSSLSFGAGGASSRATNSA